MALVGLLLKKALLEAATLKVKSTNWEGFRKMLFKNYLFVYESCVIEGLRNANQFK